MYLLLLLFIQKDTLAIFAIYLLITFLLHSQWILFIIDQRQPFMYALYRLIRNSSLYMHYIVFFSVTQILYDRRILSVMDYLLKCLPSTMSTEHKEAIQGTTRKMLDHVSNRGRRYVNMNIVVLNNVRLCKQSLY